MTRPVYLAAILFAVLLLPQRFSHASGPPIVRIVQEYQATKPSKTALVFVHGIFGAKSTWQGDKAYWPALMNQSLAGAADIYRVDYESFGDAKNGLSVTNIVKAMSDQIDEVVQPKRYSQIIFVAHSLGGNIVRAYLLKVKLRQGHLELDRYPTAFFLATPSEGSTIASYGQLVLASPLLRALVPLDENDFLQLVMMGEGDWITKHSAVGCTRNVFLYAYEKKPLLGVMVVPKASALPWGGNESFVSQQTIRGFERNHSTIVKPESLNDPVHRWVADKAKACLKGEWPCNQNTNISETVRKSVCGAISPGAAEHAVKNGGGKEILGDE
ncbi:alpha/beta fold hydrolase [Acidovorax sp. JMULE5]|uniref:esterase/lipase family protein n=1 Tax=Acidovorax sp. JMULE5 TaxID=2518343 RepID=UPI0015A1762B|nr:alpha/beta fold hydrolase [Acidovorax sp. JMULE5]QLA82506.1 alpha/beta fold hydrolase [Acidovorax sp. JMULE5]